MTGSRKAALSAALLLLGILVGGLLGEASLRVYSHFNGSFAAQFRGWDPLAILIEPHGELGYRQKPQRTFHYWNGTSATSNRMGYRGPLVKLPKPPGTFRVVLVGGSTSHGWGVNDSETIDRFLEAELSHRYPGIKVEVVNLAFDAYDSWQAFERLRSDGIRMEPDLVIVNTGINDVRNSRIPGLTDRDSRTLIWEADLARMREEERNGGPSAKSLLKHYSYLLRFPGYVRGRIWRQERRAAASALADPFPEAADYFARNLSRIDSLLGSHSIPAVYSTPPSSLTINFAPDSTSTLSYWVVNASVTQSYRDTLARRMRDFVARRAGSGRPVWYIHADLPGDRFLDDCHLNPLGNYSMALDLAGLIDRTGLLLAGGTAEGTNP